MFAYCNNNPVGLSDSDGNSLLHDLWRKAEAVCWHIISNCLDKAGYTLTANLLSQSADGEDLAYIAGNGSYASEMCRNDVGIQQSVNTEIAKLRPDRNGRVNGSWSYTIPLSNGDLGAALHVVTISVDGRVDGTTLHATVTITDTFDFTELKNPLTQGSVINGLLWLANDIAYFDSEWGLLDPVSVTIRYEEDYHYVVPTS